VLLAKDRLEMPAFPFRPLALRLALAGALAGIAGVATSPATAQNAACQEGGKIMNQRQAIVAQLSSLGKNKIDPRQACPLFGKLVSNGSAAIKWMEANKDWCSIPDAFVENIKGDHAKAADLRGKACAAAAQVQAMEKKALQAQQEGGGAGGGGAGGMLGGPGLTGSFKLPQGAL
jgi:hypothetical protein